MVRIFKKMDNYINHIVKLGLKPSIVEKDPKLFEEKKRKNCLLLHSNLYKVK